jgi:hypothetical protein
MVAIQGLKRVWLYTEYCDKSELENKYSVNKSLHGMKDIQLRKCWNMNTFFCTLYLLGSSLFRIYDRVPIPVPLCLH